MPLHSISAGLIARSFCVRYPQSSKSLSFPNASIGGSTRLATLSLSKVESRRIWDWTPDPFDVAQGRGEQHSRTTIKTFGGDAFGTDFHQCLFDTDCARD